MLTARLTPFPVMYDSECNLTTAYVIGSKTSMMVSWHQCVLTLSRSNKAGGVRKTGTDW